MDGEVEGQALSAQVSGRLPVIVISILTAWKASAKGVGSSVGTEKLRPECDCEGFVAAFASQFQVELRSSFALSSVDDVPSDDAYISHLGRLVRMRANSCKSGSEEKEDVCEQKERLASVGKRKGLSKQYSHIWGWKVRYIQARVAPSMDVDAIQSADEIVARDRI